MEGQTTGGHFTSWSLATAYGCLSELENTQGFM